MKVGTIMNFVVDVEALNLRSSPDSSHDGNIVGSLFMGQQIGALSDPDANGWVRCEARVDGVGQSGFVASKHLRAPLSPSREALVESVHREWLRFRRGTGVEHVDPFAGFVGEMWSSIDLPHDGRDVDIPWSAAAISFMVRNAGEAYAGFKFAAAHSRYVHHAIRAREAEDRSVPFWGVRLHEGKPQVGDIVCRGRAENTVTFEVARSSEFFKSHCDIIMRIDSPGQKVIAIGGNVSHSVGVTTYDLAAGNLLAPTKRVYALLRNITDEA